MVKNPPTNTGDIRDMGLIPGLGRSKAWQPTPVFLAGESHGQRSLARYSPWGHKESDTHTHTQSQLLDLKSQLWLYQHFIFIE